jgi:hypothetical protein
MYNKVNQDGKGGINAGNVSISRCGFGNGIFNWAGFRREGYDFGRLEVPTAE